MDRSNAQFHAEREASALSRMNGAKTDDERRMHFIEARRQHDLFRRCCIVEGAADPGPGIYQNCSAS